MKRHLCLAAAAILLGASAGPASANGPCISFEGERVGFVEETVYEVWALMQPWACPAGLCWSARVRPGDPAPVYCPAFPKKILGVDTIVDINVSIKSGGPGYPVMFATGCDQGNHISSAQEGQVVYSRKCVLSSTYWE